MSRLQTSTERACERLLCSNKAGQILKTTTECRVRADNGVTCKARRLPRRLWLRRGKYFFRSLAGNRSVQFASRLSSALRSSCSSTPRSRNHFHFGGGGLTLSLSPPSGSCYNYGQLSASALVTPTTPKKKKKSRKEGVSRVHHLRMQFLPTLCPREERI